MQHFYNPYLGVNMQQEEKSFLLQDKFSAGHARMSINYTEVPVPISCDRS